MHLLRVALLVGGIASVGATPQSYAIHEKRDVLYSHWEKRDRLHPQDMLPLRVGLSQSNLENGHNLLMDISDPLSPNYGKHWTAEEVIEMFSPSNETVEIVTTWLVGSGIARERIVHTDNKSWLAISVSVQETEDLLQTEYYQFEHPSLDHVTVACDEYKLPAHIRNHVDYITPGIRLSNSLKRKALKRDISETVSPKLTKFQAPKGQINPENDLSTCDQVITPHCIATLYNIPNSHRAYPGNSLGIFEHGDNATTASLNLFFANFTPWIPQNTCPHEVDIDIVPSPDTSQEHGEAELDFQLAYPIVWPQNITSFQVDDAYYTGYGWEPGKGLFNTFLDAIDGSYCTYSAFGETGDDPTIDPVYPDTHSICNVCGTANNWHENVQCGVFEPTSVISISYGEPEASLPAAYQQRQCNEFLKLGLQGVSIIVSSGDNGVSESTGCLGPDATIFSPSYPANCPYVTSVGATKVYPGRTIFEPESVAFVQFPYPLNASKYDYSSGGGFSNIYSAPSYQTSAVANFFQNHNPSYPYYETSNGTIDTSGGLYNRLGRGIPDVSANGDNIATYVQGQFTLGAGTSASTPIFASIINRINDERLFAGKKTVGFINPVLYAHPEMLNDITNGTNPGCGTEGFSAVTGWDPASGLGTPNFEKMVGVWLSLP